MYARRSALEYLKTFFFISISIPLEGNVENVQSGPVLALVDCIGND